MVSMVSLEEFLVQNWFGVVGIAVAIVVPIVVYYKTSHAGPRLVYQLGSTRLISKDKRALPEQVEIRYQGRIVPRLTKTYLALWNAGRVTVKGDDIVEDDQLRLVFGNDAEVLGTSLLGVSREQNGFRAGVDSAMNTVILEFDYLDAGDGALVELLHTDEKRYPEVKGTVIGIPRGLQNWGKVRPAELRQGVLVRHGAALGMMAIGSLTTLLGVFLGFFADPPTNPSSVGSVLALGLAMVVWAFVTFWSGRRRVPRRLTIALQSNQEV